MVFRRDYQAAGRRFGESPATRYKPADMKPPEKTGAEADYLRSMVDSRVEVTVLLKTGEQLKGRIRYYDRHCFSLRLADQGHNLLLRKSDVLQIEQ